MPSQEESRLTSPAHKDRLGELLIKNKLISEDQLQVALKRRTQIDLPLGSILIEMGLISADVLLDFLSIPLQSYRNFIPFCAFFSFSFSFV